MRWPGRVRRRPRSPRHRRTWAPGCATGTPGVAGAGGCSLGCSNHVCFKAGEFLDAGAAAVEVRVEGELLGEGLHASTELDGGLVVEGAAACGGDQRRGDDVCNLGELR